MKARPPRLRLTASIAVSLFCASTTSIAAQELDQFQGRLASTFAARGFSKATWGVMVTSLDSGDTLFAIDPDQPLAPASNLKLLTTTAALRILGPDYRFRTYLLTDGTVENGVLDGDLILYGTGDPGISDRFYRSRDEVFQRLIDQLEDLGIHSVTGDLVGDASFFAGPLRPEGWDPRDLNDHFTGAVSALSFNENLVSFRVVPDKPGEPPRVQTVPDHAGLDVVNEAETVGQRARPRLAILRDHPLDPVRIEGRILSSSRDVWRQMTVPVPAHFAASVFLSTLEERGITVAGGIRVVDKPARSVTSRLTAPAKGVRGARVLARHVSEPLSTYLEVINKESNNLFAEVVFRTLGRVREGVGTPQASARAVRAALLDLGVDMSHVVQLDGSGLSSGNRVSASTFVDILGHMAGSPQWNVFWATLPEAGHRRELSRMYSTPAAGNLRAKTGTIEGVSALSGVVKSEDGERLVFSILVNGTPSTSRAKGVENRVGALLASYHRVPSLGEGVRFADADPSTDEAGSIPGARNRHQVTRGESLALIANRYGVSLDELKRANPRVTPNLIVAGEWIDIPQHAGTE